MEHDGRCAGRTHAPAVGNLEIVSTSGGFSYRARHAAASTGAALSDCPFGQIVTWVEDETAKTGIRGGVVYAGDKVWNVPNKELNLEATGTFLVWLEIGVTANVGDGVLLPGLQTSTTPEWKQVGSDGGNYPDQTIPTAPAGTGKAVVAIGLLTIADGAATLSPAGCGTIHVTHCPGSLTAEHERRTAAAARVAARWDRPDLRDRLDRGVPQEPREPQVHPEPPALPGRVSSQRPPPRRWSPDSCMWTPTAI